MPSSGETSVSAWFGSKKNNNAMVFCLYLFLSHCTDAEQIRSVGSHWGNYYCVKYQSSFSNQAVLRLEPWTTGREVWTLPLCHAVPLKIISQSWVIPSYLKSSHLKGKKVFFNPFSQISLFRLKLSQTLGSLSRASFLLWFYDDSQATTVMLRLR